MGLMVDLFAGGGGASLGMEMALGRAVDVAINHNPEAVAIHAANHPSTRHFIQNICSVLPRDATGGRPVDVLWASPDCKHFSKAKGTAPKERNIRELAWAVVRWVRDTRPKLVCVENVEEFQTWGPLDGDGQPIKARAGETFRRWVREIEREGYRVDWRLLRACDFGAPTIRRRLFIVARRDRRPVKWPEASHGPGCPKPYRTAAECIDWSLPVPSIFDRKKPLAENTLKRIAEGLRRYVIETDRPFIVRPDQAAWILQANTGLIGRAAGDPLSTICQTGSQQQLVVASLVHYYGTYAGWRPRCGDLAESFRTATAAGNRFGLVMANMVQVNHAGPDFRGQSVKKPLPTITQKHGFGLTTAFLAKTNHTADYYRCFRGQGLADPLQTITQSPGFSVVAARLSPYLVGAGGPRYGAKPVWLDKPLGTLTAENHRAMVAAHLSHFNGTFQDGVLWSPMKTVTAGGLHAGLVAAFLAKYYGTALAEPVTEPLSTVTGRPKLGLVSAFLAKYYGKNEFQPVTGPMGTVTTRHRYGLVLVHFMPLVRVDGELYVITDIGLRMLTPRELARAQGFPDGYVFDPIVDGRPLTQKAQVAAIGNSVPPAFSDALVRANVDALAEVTKPVGRRKSVPLLDMSLVEASREGPQ